ncbi:MAG: signal recognition particle-docking protein FtsY [Pseudomonadota bacterium]
MFGRKSKDKEKPAPAAAEEAPQGGDKSAEKPKGGFIKRLRARLNKGDSWLTYDLANLVPGGKIDEDLLEELETRLLSADVGVDATERIMSSLNSKVARKELADADALLNALKGSLTEILQPCEQPLPAPDTEGPWMLLMIGVNGAGKTTTIGKLAQNFRAQGKSVLLAAGDTFRAAAIEQLQTWGERNNVPVIAQAPGADPAAVIFDALEAARARNIDVVIADTAGRLHTQGNLMEELKKIKRVVGKIDATAPHEVMLVLDAGIGQNALNQARQFNDAVGVTGLTVTKLDGTAKGGVVVALAQDLGLPIRFIGVGETADDLGTFRAADYADALLKGNSGDA